MTWLITGGAGYIGAHVARDLAQAGQPVAVYDDLSTGDAARVPDGVPLVVGSTLDRTRLDSAFREFAVTGVVHLAAKKQVAESVEQPLRYYRENLLGLQTLLEATVAAGARRFVFSSSAAVYGSPDVDLVTEATPCLPMNPYGETKLAGERLVRFAGQAYGIATASLRYFNVAGAASPELADASTGSLVPMVFERLAAGQAPMIFGDDYPTPDGTCVRDFIHVSDVASAHLAAARRLSSGGVETGLTLNVGRGEGVSVREMVELIGSVTGHHQLPPVVAARRPGDVARSVASADLIGRELGWSARYGVADMIESAWCGWHRLHSRAEHARS